MSFDKIYLPKLHGSGNYDIWSIRAKAALIKEDLYGPIENASEGIKNNKAISLLKLYCDDGPLLYLKDIDSAKEAWQRLEDLYYPKGFTTEFLLLKEFFNLKLNDFDSIEEYLNRVKTLAGNLKGKNIELPRQVIIAWILNRLPPDYESFIQNIAQGLRNNSKAYSVDTLFSSLIDEARGREGTIGGYYTDLMVLRHKKAYKNRPYNSRYCEHCRSTRHNTNKCWLLFPNLAPKGWTPKGDRANKAIYPRIDATKQSHGNRLKRAKIDARKPRILTEREKKQHNDAIISSIVHSPTPINAELDCEIPDLYTKPEEMLYTNNIAKNNKDLDIAMTPLLLDDNLYEDPKPKMAEIEEEVCFPLITNSAKDANNSSLDNIGFKNPIGQKVNFIIDSAATISTISNLSYFSSYSPTSTIVKWGKASSIKATYKGEIYIKTDIGFIYLLKEIYYIPSLGINLISINQLTDLIALFMKNKVYLYTPLRRIVAIGKKEENLYYIKAKILYTKNSEKTSYNTINSINTINRNSYKAINNKGIVNTIRL
jgi:hypothetical protein